MELQYIKILQRNAEEFQIPNIRRKTARFVTIQTNVYKYVYYQLLALGNVYDIIPTTCFGYRQYPPSGSSSTQMVT